MWHNLTLRARVLLGYVLILVLSSALVLFLVLRIDSLSSRIERLSAAGAAEADANTRVASQLAVIQRVVGTYVQQPDAERLQAARDALQKLVAEIAHARTILTSPAQLEQLDDLERRRVAYQRNIDSLSAMIVEQQPIRDNLNAHLTQANALLNSVLVGYLVDGGAQIQVASDLANAQASLQQAGVAVARMVGERSDETGASVIAALDAARKALGDHRPSAGSIAGPHIDQAIAELVAAKDLANQLIGNIMLVGSQQQTLLAQQESILDRQAAAITQNAVSNLSDTTNQLAAQALRMRQVAGIALVVAVLVAAAAGLQLASTISRPVQELVAATSRLNQGDYDVVVSERAGGEIGQLASAFNRMTAALNQQRIEVRCQQEAMARRNDELELALDQVRAANQAREALATTVRNLSVPVVSILEHVVVLPLVGELDAQRGHLLLERLLAGVSEQRARIAILDVTGVPFVDIEVAKWLLRAATATALLGAQCMLVGISPEVAQALVASGASLDGLVTRADLRSAVEYAMHLNSQPQSVKRKT
jgi:rsbT co-antagonist protein RsbR